MTSPKAARPTPAAITTTTAVTTITTTTITATTTTTKGSPTCPVNITSCGNRCHLPLEAAPVPKPTPAPPDEPNQVPPATRGCTCPKTHSGTV